MSEMWTNENCPICNACNWFCLGDADGGRDYDLEGMWCYECGHKWHDKESVDEFDWDTDNIDYVIGVHMEIIE